MLSFSHVQEEELPSSSEDEEDRKRVDSDAEELEYRKKRLSVAESVAQEHKQARDAIVKVALDAFLLPQLTQIICSYNDNLQEAHLQIVCDFGKAIAQSESSEVCPFHLCKQLNLVAKTLGEDEEEDQSVVVVDYGSSVIKAGTSGEPFVTASFGSYCEPRTLLCILRTFVILVRCPCSGSSRRFSARRVGRFSAPELRWAQVQSRQQLHLRWANQLRCLTV